MSCINLDVDDLEQSKTLLCPELIVNGETDTGCHSKEQEYRELLRELKELHFMMSDFHQVIQQQSEVVNAVEQSVQTTNNHVLSAESEIKGIQETMLSAKRWGYFDFIRTQVIPIATAAGLHGPIMYLAGTKTGLISIPLTYSLVSWLLS